MIATQSKQAGLPLGGLLSHSGALLRAGGNRAVRNAGDSLGAMTGYAAKALHVTPELGNVKRIPSGFGRYFQQGFRDVLRPEPAARDLSSPAPAMRAPGWHSGNPGWAEGTGAELNGPAAIRGQRPDIQRAGQLNPNILKQAKFMKQSQLLGLAFAVQDQMQKEAMTGAIERGMGALRGMAGKAVTVLDKGFTRLGQAAEGVQNPMLAKLLTGAAPNTSAMAGYAGDAANALGKTVAKRVGAGAGIAAGGTLAAEAPFKYENNQQVEQQKQHPLKTWLAQHLQGKRPAVAENYLNPLAI